MSSNDVISPILNLPEEILVEIFSHLPTSTLLRGVAQTCRTWYWIVRRESESGRILKSLDIDRNWLGPDAPDVVETFSEILSCYGSAQSFRFRNFDRKTLTSVVDDVLKVSDDVEVKKLSFVSCDCSTLSISDLGFLGSLHFCLESIVPVRIVEQISGSFRNLTELKIPNIPAAFVPLVVQNHSKIQGNFKLNIW